MNTPAVTGDISTQQKGDSFLFDATYPKNPTTEDHSGRRGNPLRVAIIDAVSLEFDVPVNFLFLARRTRKIAWARQAAWWLIYRYTQASTSRLGGWFGRDHSTVVYALAAVEQRRRSPKTQAEQEFAHRLARLDDRFIVTREPTKKAA